MAPLMQQDPWLWSVDDVVEFFKSEAPRIVAQQHGSKLPPSPQFTDTLVEQEINGPTLLRNVNDRFLRKDCKIKALGVRDAVVYCIDMLKNRSNRLKSQFNVGTSDGEPMQLDQGQANSGVEPETRAEKPKQPAADSSACDGVVQPPSANDAVPAQRLQSTTESGEPMQLDNSQPAAPPSSEQAIGENVRSQETSIQGQDGKKRRRLQLVPTAEQPTGQPSATQQSGVESHPVDYDLCLSANKQPVDQVFFGDTAVGSECVPLQVANPNVIPLGRGPKEFEFIASQQHAGVAQYIDSQWRRFNNTNEETSLRRSKTDATALFPYRVNLQAEKAPGFPEFDRRGRILFSGPRSALVIQQNMSRAPASDGLEESSFIAIREDEDLLESGAKELGFSKEQIALLDGPYAHLLRKYQPAEDSEQEYGDYGSTESLGDEMTESGDEMAEVVDDDEQVSKSEVKQIIRNVIDTYISHWKEQKLPGLESKSAWTTWRKTKRSKFLRDQLIQGASNTIQRLESRLRMFVDDMESAEWDNKSSLEKQCESLQVTVEDVQLEIWKIEVWQRKKEPEHVSACGTAHKHTSSTSAQQRPNELQEALRHMGPDDRLSTSPQAQPPPPADLVDGAARGSDIEGERFHTPQGSPVHQPDHDSFIVPDDDEEHGAAHATTGALPAIDAPEAVMHDESILLSDPRQNGMPITPHGPSKTVELKMPTSSTRLQNPDLPSPSTSTLPNQGSQGTPIVLDSSPTNPTTPSALRTTKHNKKRKQSGEKSIKAETERTPRTSEADSWSFEKLAHDEDRESILKKHLRDIGPQKREELHNTYQILKAGKFRSHLMAAQEVIRGAGFEESPHRVSNPRSANMKLCARLLLSWYFARPDAVHNETIPQDLIDMPQVGDSDVAIFVNRLHGYLCQRSTPLYSGVKVTSLDDPMIIDTDDEEAIPRDLELERQSRSLKKRRKVKRDLVAQSNQNAALARQLKSQQQQSSNPEILQELLSAGSSQEQRVINLTRGQDDEPIHVRGKLAREMKPYQQQGVQFMWRELTADPETGKGCLLAHTMGLGKTMQSIALLTCVDNASKSDSANVREQLPKALRLTEARKGCSLRYLVICPPPLVQNWRRELNLWAPQHHVYIVESSKAGFDHVQTLEQWAKTGGVLFIGYHLFRSHVQRNAGSVDEAKQSEVERVQHILLKECDLIIADEAHHIKNTESGTSQALSKIETRARVALSGTPMSNDVDEIYALVSWIDPGYFGDKTQFNYFYGTPIKDGLYADSSPSDKRSSTIKLKLLHEVIEPKVNRADISVLKGSLKPKVEFVLTVELTELQRDAYAMTVAALVGTGEILDSTALTRIFSWLAVLSHLTAHPLIFRHKLLTPQKPKKNKVTVAKATQAANDLDVNDAVQVIDDEMSGVESEQLEGSPEAPGDESPFVLGFTEAIVNELVKNLRDDLDPDLSAKTRLLRQIIQLSKQCGDKVLVFSSHIPTLDYLRDLFTHDGIRFRRIDGSVAMPKRNQSLADFQAGNIDVMLISTRAGGQGLNIQEANRVVIFDFGFNPAWEEQAIGRSYRLGQQKPVFVYRFVAGGTFESNIYNTQMFKTTLMKRVVDKKNPKRQAARNTKDYLYPPRPVKHEDVSNELELDLDPQVMSKIMQAQVDRGSARDPSIDICAIRTMEVLQAEAADEPLNEEELRRYEENRTAWKQINSAGPSVHANHAAFARPNGVPSSTAPAMAPPGTSRAASGLSATQIPSNQIPSASHAVGRAHTTNTTLAPRDIRNQAASAGETSPPKRAGSMGGLPFVRPS